ncbi:MAG: US12 family protein, partial [Lachnospiraceae bacterium]|nr:US12 family protein [Lachnospiraceae bacterium]
MNNKEIKLKRLTSTDGTPLSEGAYNVTIGLTILWGLLLNILTAIFLTPYIMQIDYRIILIGYLVLSFACIAVVFKSHTPAISFLGFTGLAFVMGVLLTFFLTAYSASSIYSAFLTTGIIVLSMMILSMFFPAFFLSIGRVLIFALIGSIVIELIGGLLLHLPLGIMDYVVVVIFAGYIGYDWAKAQAYPKTLDNA